MNVVQLADHRPPPPPDNLALLIAAEAHGIAVEDLRRLDQLLPTRLLIGITAALIAHGATLASRSEIRRHIVRLNRHRSPHPQEAP